MSGPADVRIGPSAKAVGGRARSGRPQSNATAGGPLLVGGQRNCKDLPYPPPISMVSVGPQGHHDHPARDPRALASGRLSPLLALEIALAGGRPQIEADLRALIRRMSVENPLWGAPRIHGELLKLGFAVAQSSVAKYMVKRRGPPGQGWRTFLRNQAPDIAAMDLFIVPTIGFDLLYAFCHYSASASGPHQLT